MKRVLITALTLFLMSAGLTAVGQAVEPAAKPFVHVSTSQNKIDLGTSGAPGYHSVSNAVTLNVDSNCLHGPIVVSVTNLKHPWGASIPPDRIAVRSPATNGFVSMDRPVAVSGPTKGPHKIVLDLQVQTWFQDRAGRYSGTFTVTIMPPV